MTDRFVRYADDCNIYVRSRRAGGRVLDGVERFLMKRLRLVVNRDKSAVDVSFRQASVISIFLPQSRPAPSGLPPGRPLPKSPWAKRDPSSDHTPASAHYLHNGIGPEIASG